jgi:uncharacterized membrane protein
LIFQMAAGDFYIANQGRPDIMRDVTLRWALLLGDLALAALYTMGIMNRRGDPTIRDGAIIGGVYGFLVWFGVDFIIYGFVDTWNLTLTIVDPILSFIHAGIAGAVIAGVLSKIPKSA